MVLGLTINLLNLRVMTKMLDYNFIIYIKIHAEMYDVLSEVRTYCLSKTK
jgi:hypothetical protein